MKKRGTILLILVIHFFIGNAQTINSKHFTVADNLPSNICYKILQDEKNYIWIATEKGIVVFNGYDFKPLYLKNKLDNLDIWGLYKDSKNRIWLKSKQSN
ncbi:MAG: hypothetical protein KA275_06115, partial [Chitinophagaceae bacterium]|nr:hypothetical protein [Chitinophagaceae bacterium]